jgi:class 3 adenylate cyclase
MDRQIAQLQGEFMSEVMEVSPLQSGRDAAARHAWHEAHGFLQEADGAGALTPDDLRALGEAAWWLGRLDESIAVRERAFAAYLAGGDKRTAAVMALTLANDYWGKLAHSIGAGWFSKGERLLEDEPECAEQGWLSMMNAFAALYRGDYAETLVGADRTLDIGTRFGDRDLQAFGLVFKGCALVALGDVQEGLPLLDEATVAAVSGELRPFSTGMIYCVAITATSKLSDYSRSGQWTEASKRWCDRQSIVGFPGICRVHRAEIMRLRGFWSEAEQEARRALSELQTFNPMLAAEGFSELGEVRLRMGDLEGAEEAFRQAHQSGHEPQPGLALVRLAQGNVKAARSSLRRALDERDTGDRLHRMKLLPAQVEVELAAGDLEAARGAVTEMEEIVATYSGDVFQALALWARGALQLAEGDNASAVRTSRQSWRLWTKADLPYEAARARLTLGVALRADGDEDGAQLEIGAAKSSFEKLGATLDLRRALELLGEEIAEGVPRATSPVERVTKSFVFTDIVGSTDLAGVLGDEAWSDVLSWHDSTMRRLLTDHHGEEVKHVGDGFFVAFDDPTRAVEFAVDVQRKLAAHRKEAGFAPQVRIGIHCADASKRGRDYEGMGVHVAARIGALAGGDEILASQDVVDATRLRFPVSGTREVRLKGVAEPVAVASISRS